MTLRNLVIAAGATLAAAGAVTAIPAVADAQVYGYGPGYHAEYRHFEREREFRRIEARRYWEHRRFAPIYYHHSYAPYRY